MKTLVKFDCSIGDIHIEWTNSNRKITRIYLPEDPIFVTNEASTTAVLKKGDKLPDLLNQVLLKLEHYFTGKKTEFSFELLDVSMYSAFRQRVYRQAHAIPWGETRSYADVASLVESPNSARAVGATMASNPVPIIIPCHRVVSSDGSLRGYRGGLEMKKQLLRIEHKS